MVNYWKLCSFFHLLLRCNISYILSHRFKTKCALSLGIFLVTVPWLIYFSNNDSLRVIKI